MSAGSITDALPAAVPPPRPGRFDAVAIAVATTALLVVGAYVGWYLLFRWPGPSPQVAALRWTVIIFGSLRLVLYLVDRSLGAGLYLTRHPAMAHVDLAAVGIVMACSMTQAGRSYLWPLIVVHLALVPILYRNIERRRLAIACTLLLVVEALSWQAVPVSMSLYVRRHLDSQRQLQGIARDRDALRPAPSPRKAPDTRELDFGDNNVARDLALELHAAVQSAEETRRDIEPRLLDMGPVGSLTPDQVRLFLADMPDLEQDVAELRELAEDRSEDLVMALSRDPAEVLQGGNPHHDVLLAAQRSVREWADYLGHRVAAKRLELEQRRFELEGDPAALLSELAVALMAVILGFLVQFHIQRFVAKRIEVEREQTLSEMIRERQRLDVENWINLTAGLTHNIGNEVQGYHVYSEEVLEWMDAQDGGVPADIVDKVRFIFATNSARLGFVKFLREFAILKKAYQQERPVPGNLARISLGRLIPEVRERVATIETCYNPPDSTDPGDTRRRAKFLSTPLLLEFAGGEKDLTVRQGRTAVLDFVFYELLKNALRHCSGKYPLRLRGERVGSNIHLELVNDLAVESAGPGDCRRCGTRSERRQIIAALGKEALCPACFRRRVEKALDLAFFPGQGSGTGLGLFVIKHFLEEYYYGQINCSLDTWDDTQQVYRVAFHLQFPDDLAEVIETKNRMMREVEP